MDRVKRLMGLAGSIVAISAGACSEPLSVHELAESALQIPRAMLAMRSTEGDAHREQLSDTVKVRGARSDNYPTNPDGTPDYTQRADVYGSTDVAIVADGSRSNWQVTVTTTYRGSRSTHQAQYNITHNGAQVFAGTLSGQNGGFFHNFSPGYTSYSSRAANSISTNCGNEIHANSNHMAVYEMPSLFGSPLVSWGDAYANSNGADYTASCPPPAPAGGSSQQKVGPDGQWYACYIVDYYDARTGLVTSSVVLYCVPIETY